MRYLQSDIFVELYYFFLVGCNANLSDLIIDSANYFLIFCFLNNNRGERYICMYIYLAESSSRKFLYTFISIAIVVMSYTREDIANNYRDFSGYQFKSGNA